MVHHKILNLLNESSYSKSVIRNGNMANVKNSVGKQNHI